MIDVKSLAGEYLNNIKPQEVLDLGCGVGKKSIRFLKSGAHVTGVDKKDIKIHQENFKFIQSDLKEYKFEKQYDLIITSLILHFLKDATAREIIKTVKEHTTEEGLNFLICMSNEDSCSKEKPENFYPAPEELRELYSEWEILREDNGFTIEEEHDNLPPHRHHLIFLLAKKRFL